MGGNSSSFPRCAVRVNNALNELSSGILTVRPDSKAGPFLFLTTPDVLDNEPEHIMKKEEQHQNKTRPPFTKEERERIEKACKKHGIKMVKPRDPRPFIMFRKEKSE